MPPVDPRNRPALTRALPGDAVPPGGDSGYRAAGEPCEVLFGDGAWHVATLRSWRRDRHGRWVASLEWGAEGGTWTESYQHNPARMREC